MATMSVGGINDSVRRGTHSDQTKARAILDRAKLPDSGRGGKNKRDFQFNCHVGNRRVRLPVP